MCVHAVCDDDTGLVPLRWAARAAVEARSVVPILQNGLIHTVNFGIERLMADFGESDQESKRAIKSSRLCPRDAQRADKKEIACRSRKERPLMGKKCVIFPKGGLSSYDIQPLY